MEENTCGMCIIYSYVSYISCFCCMILKEYIQEKYKEWKNSSNTKGFNKYEIIPKQDDNIVNIVETNNQIDNMERQINFEGREAMRTINLNESTSTILKNWTIRPSVSDSTNDLYKEAI
mgnify:CR=1 FL=1